VNRSYGLIFPIVFKIIVPFYVGLQCEFLFFFLNGQAISQRQKKTEIEKYQHINI